MIDKIVKKKYKLLVSLIVLLAAFLRFINYPTRFGIAYDQAHDALVARFAAENFLLPLVGPFSSGAQFQTSGIWYWFLMLPSFFFNQFLIAPWIATTLYCILFVFLVIYVAEKLIDKKFALIAGLFAAISTSQLGQSTNLSLTALISVASIAAIFFVYKYLDTPKNIYIYWIGFFTALAPSIHLQGVLLGVLIPIFLLMAKVRSLRAYFYLALGLLTPLVPLIIFDLQNNFVNITGLLNHFFNKQYDVSYEVLGRRWLTYLSVFWPSAWANILGGVVAIAYITILSIIAVFIRDIKEKSLGKIWIIIAVTFLLDLILMRYVRSPLFDSYLNFLHPFVFLLSAYAVYKLIKWKTWVGLILLFLILAGSLVRDIGEVTYPGNVATINAVNDMKALINKKFPNESFDFYDYQYMQVGGSLPLVLVMDTDGRVNKNERKIGITSAGEATLSAAIYPNLGVAGGYLIVDLDGSSSAELVKNSWHRVNPEDIYNNTENWNK